MTAPESAELDDLLGELRRRDVRLTVRAGQLDYDAPADALDPELLATMRRLKPALLDRLGRAGGPTATPGATPAPAAPAPTVPAAPAPTVPAAPAPTVPAAPAPTATVTAGDGDGGGDWRVLATGPTSIGQARQYQITRETTFPQVLTVAFRLTLDGPLDRTALRRALTDLTVRQSALRTRLAVGEDGVWQQVLAPRPVPLPVRTVPADDLDRAVDEWASIPFDLEREPAFRAALFQPDGPAGPDDHRHELTIAIHHGFVDGWSVQPLLDDLAEFYRAAVTGRPAELPPLPGEFVDFCRWEAEYLSRPETRQMLREWVDGLPAGTVPLRLPTDRPRVPLTTDPGGVLHHTFPPDLVAAVTSYAVSRGATPYAVLAAAFTWLLHDLTGAPTVNLVASVANRTDPRYDRVVGVFAQAALLLVPVAGVASFDELVQRTARVTWQALARQSVPSSVQIAALGEAFTNFPCRVYFDLLDMADPVLHLTGLAPAPARDVVLAGSRGDLTWQLRPLPEGGMALLIEYATNLFDVDTVAGWLGRYQRLLSGLLAAPDAPLPRDGAAGVA
ncbi:condensation domain-containing protein [Micromonospora sp. NPDC023956]|uniref:condensation domain-containing protein n=1 Tax=Micromonospora sp. NPDC023956 TaxID=3155722 RepID=UPI0033FA878F